MLVFFVTQGMFILLELWAGVARWHPLLAHTWTVVAVLGCSPLFIEPLLQDCCRRAAMKLTPFKAEEQTYLGDAASRRIRCPRN
jgi:hypothetical protein